MHGSTTGLIALRGSSLAHPQPTERQFAPPPVRGGPTHAGAPQGCRRRPLLPRSLFGAVLEEQGLSGLGGSVLVGQDVVAHLQQKHGEGQLSLFVQSLCRCVQAPLWCLCGVLGVLAPSHTPLHLNDVLVPSLNRHHHPDPHPTMCKCALPPTIMHLAG